MRWHTNPWLSRTHDRVDGHSARVARIIFALHPKPSMVLIKAALIHDDGEFAVGDVKAPAKDADPVFAGLLADREAVAREGIWGSDAPLTDDEARWLKFADCLDAWTWARHHRAPMNRDGWPQAMRWLFTEAQVLGCEQAWTDLVRAME